MRLKKGEALLEFALGSWRGYPAEAERPRTLNCVMFLLISPSINSPHTRQGSTFIGSHCRATGIESFQHLFSVLV